LSIGTTFITFTFTLTYPGSSLCVHNLPTLNPVLNQLKSGNTSTPYFSKIPVNPNPTYAFKRF